MELFSHDMMSLLPPFISFDRNGVFMKLPTISPSLPASASTQPLLRCCLTSVQPLLDETLFEKALSCLPADGCWALRKEKLLRLQKPEDRALTLAAGLLARLAFLKMDVDFSLLSIEKNGKPVILDERHFFNLSHSGSYAACVYGTYPCGIDIQKHTPDRFHVAERCFTPLEQKKIREEGAQCFTRIWTVKESYLKYTGQGIRIPLNSIEVLPGRLQQKTDEDPASRDILSEAETQIFSAESSSAPERSPLPVFVREFALSDYWIALTSPVRIEQPPILLSIEELLSV